MALGPPVATKPSGFAVGFCGDRRPSGHVFHTSRQAMIKTYSRTCATLLVSSYSRVNQCHSLQCNDDLIMLNSKTLLKDDDGHWGMNQFYKSENTPVPYPTMLHSEQKCADFCSEWSVVGYGTCALWDLWIGSVVTSFPDNISICLTHWDLNIMTDICRYFQICFFFIYIFWLVVTEVSPCESSRPISHIPQYIIQNRNVHIPMMPCGIWNRCIVGCVNLVYWQKVNIGAGNGLISNGKIPSLESIMKMFIY